MGELVGSYLRCAYNHVNTKLRRKFNRGCLVAHRDPTLHI